MTENTAGRPSHEPATTSGAGVSRPSVGGAIHHPVTGSERAPGRSVRPETESSLGGRPGPAVQQPLSSPNATLAPRKPDDLVRDAKR
jgi:hypothetical protein